MAGEFSLNYLSINSLSYYIMKSQSLAVLNSTWFQAKYHYTHFKWILLGFLFNAHFAFLIDSSNSIFFWPTYLDTYSLMRKKIRIHFYPAFGFGSFTIHNCAEFENKLYIMQCNITDVDNHFLVSLYNKICCKNTFAKSITKSFEKKMF